MGLFKVLQRFLGGVALIAAGILSSTAFANAQSGACYVQGRILDLNGSPLTGATVYAVSRSVPGVSPSETTDNAGYYRISNLAEGAYSITAGKSGCVFRPGLIMANVLVEGATGGEGCGSDSNLYNFVAECAGTGLIYEISGKVVKTDGVTPAASVTVSAGGGLIGVTDNAGAYRISVPAGTYSVQPITPPGSAAPQTVRITTDDVSGINFRLTANPQLRTIRGTVRQSSGSPFPGVFVAAGIGRSALTSATGSYEIAVPDGTYALGPVFPGVTFGSSPRTVTVSGADLSGQDFTANSSPAIYSVSGTVRDGDLVGVSGITVSVGGVTTVTDSAGRYTVSNLTVGTFKASAIAPTGKTVSPAEITVKINGGNVSNVDFYLLTNSLSRYPIFGQVRFADGTGVPVIRITQPLSILGVYTDSSGFYATRALTNGNYNVSADRPGYTFTKLCPSPAIINSAPVYGCDFIASCDVNYYRLDNRCISTGTYSISGRVISANGFNASGVTVRIGSQTVQSGSDGSYTLAGLANGTYLVAPQLAAGVTSSPANTLVQVRGANVSGVNFTLSGPGFTNFTLSGAVRFSDSAPLSNVRIFLNNSSSQLTGVSGGYSFSGLVNGTYTLRGELTGYVITPNFGGTVVVNNSAATNRDFTASCASGYSRQGAICIPTPVNPPNPPDPPPPPSEAILLSASDDASPSAINVQWSAITSAAQYVLYRSDYAASIGTILVSNLSTTSYADISAVPGVTHYYTVIGIKSTGAEIVSNQDGGRRRSDGILPSPKLRSPVYAKYNTFLKQFNFLELISAGTAPVEALITVYSKDGQVIKTQSHTIAAGTEVDLSIHDAVNRTDTYGLVRVDFNDTAPGVNLLGRMSNYRKNPGKSDYSFAFSRELRNATRGVTYALANSVDPLGKKNLVPNWGELINVNPNRWVNFIQRVYNREGQLLKTYNVKLAPLGEVDTQCGHENGQGAYLCEFIPEDGSTQYLSTVARYSENSLRRRPAETYNFAFALEGRAGADEPIYAPIRNERGECWSEQTWLEIANVREVPVIATVTYRDADGLALGSSGPTKVTIQPKAQVYLNASGMLTIGGVGSAEVSANQPGSIVAQSMFYYYDCKTNRVQSGFASALRTAQEQLQIGTYNTNLGMSNYLQVVSITPNPFDLNVTFGWRSPGANDLQILSPGSVRIDPRESVRIGLNSGPFARSPNTYGTVTLSSGLSRSYIAEVIRVREDSSGRIDFISTTSVR